MSVRGSVEVLDTLEAQLDPAHTALVLVDVQNDFVHPDGTLARANLANFLDLSMVGPMLTHTQRLLDGARRAGALRVFVQMLGDRRYQSGPQLALQRRRQGGATTGPPATASASVLEGTWGADFYGDIRPDGGDAEIVVQKYRYSAFVGTNLDLVLRSHAVKTLVMCGDATSGCVESTTRDGFFHDYYVVTAADACADFERGRHEASLRKMDQSFGYVVPTDEVLRCWNR